MGITSLLPKRLLISNNVEHFTRWLYVDINITHIFGNMGHNLSIWDFSFKMQGFWSAIAPQFLLATPIFNPQSKIPAEKTPPKGGEKFNK
jgi:hypothetical protein